MPWKQLKMNGIWRCANYAFAPNYLKYCGPDENKELAEYLKHRAVDLGLKEMLMKFEAMSPYLQLIARENGLADVFDERVVEAYWLGNGLLDKVSLNGFYAHARPRLNRKDLAWFETKLPRGAKPNHQFHVFNFIRRTGYKAVPHTAETMDQCRISAGRIIAGNKVKTDRLVYQGGKLKLVPTVKKFHNLMGGFKIGDSVALHWGWAVEKITPSQAKNLKYYTSLAIKLANTAI